MRIIVNELKKIWNTKILAMIAFLIVFFAIMTNGYIETYPRGTEFYEVDFAHRLTENYGTTLEREDFEDFLNYEETIIQEINEFIATRQVFIDAGIFDFDDYQAFQEEIHMLYENLTDEEHKQRWTILAEMGFIARLRDGVTDVNPNPDEISVAYTRWGSFQNVVGRYRANVLRDTEWSAYIDNFIAYAPLNESEMQRAVEIRDSGELVNVLPFQTIFHTWRYASHIAILVILATLILVSQLIVTDRANQVNCRSCGLW